MKLSELIAQGKQAIERGESCESEYGQAVLCTRHLARAGMIDMALAASILIYNELVKPRESEAVNADFYRDTAFLENAKTFTEPAKGDGIAFVLGSGHPLGHTSVISSLLKGTQHPVFVLAPKLDPRLVQQLPQAMACPPVFGLTKKLEWLHREMTRHGCGTLVWVSGGPIVPHAFARRIAEHQVFFAMRYHGMVSNHADQLLTMWGQGGERVINGRQWAVVPSSWPWMPPKAPDEAIAPYRRRNAFAFGTVARQEKYSPEFLETLREIMEHAPDAMFLWTGRAEFADVFRAARVPSHACIGWVKPEAAIPAFDCFLETFPLGGVTTAQAMAYGVPAVFMKDVGFCGLSCPLAVESRADYVARALGMYRYTYARMNYAERQREFVAEQEARAAADSRRLFEVLRQPLREAA